MPLGEDAQPHFIIKPSRAPLKLLKLIKEEPPPFNMETAVLTSWLLFLLFSPAVPRCLPTEFTLNVERPECDFCVAINTTICMGLCSSWDSVVKGRHSPPFLKQEGCTYNKVEHHTVILPGCPIEVNPVFTYPMARSCKCDYCRTATDECAHRASSAGARCTKPVRHLS